MTQYTVHNKLSQQVMRPQAAKPEKAGTKSTQPGYIAYICMFMTLFNYTMEKKNKKQSLKKKPFIPVAQSVQSNDLKGEIVLYQPDDTISLEVRLEGDTVWLTQAQMVELFHRDQSVIARHISNIYKEKELKKEGTYAKFAYVGHDGLQEYEVSHYSLDVIIYVGYRVKSKQGTRFRQWANGVIKKYLINGYAVNQQIQRIEQRLDAKLDDALYHFGASFKDLGKRLFAFELMGIDKSIILNQL